MPRGEPLSSMLIDQEEGKRVDIRKVDEVTDERVAYIIKKQLQVGIDVANDGEQGRVGFQTYVPQRMERLRRQVEPAFWQGVCRVPQIHRAHAGAHPKDRQGV